jgi:ribonucleoside-diphosphate reductase alpha chain
MLDSVTKTKPAKPDTTLDYHALNAMLNLYDGEGRIRFDADRMAARQYFLQHVNQNTVFFHSLDEKLGYLVDEGYYEADVLDQYSRAFLAAIWDAVYEKSSGSRPSSARSSTTPPTR